MVLRSTRSGASMGSVRRPNYKWKAKYGGLEVSELVRVKELEAENSQQKCMYANLALENEAIKAVLKKL